MKKGTYYVGDPCYIFGDSWYDVLERTNYFENGEEQKLFGKMVCGGGTAYGDGVYQDNFGRSYAVDSGTIAIIPISMINRDKKFTKKELKNEDEMHVIKFESDFECSICNGIFKFGNIIIDTLNENEDDDY